MRLTHLAAIALLLIPSIAKAEKIPANTESLFEYLSMLAVANEKCVGQRYNKPSLDGNIYRLAMDQGWNQTKVEAEVQRTYKDWVDFYELNHEKFCTVAHEVRRDNREALLELKIIN